MNSTHQVGPETLLSLACVLLLTGCSINSADDQAPSPETLAGHTLEHHTTDTPPEPGPVPATVTETAWTWEGTPDTTIHAIHPTPTGALVELNNGLVGLDTTTGETTWSYLLPDSTDLEEDETDLALTPDGTMAAFSPGQTTALLDTATGQEHQLLDHQTEGKDQFTVTNLGLPHTQGSFTATSDHDLHLTLTPWAHQDQDQDTGWETTLPGCDDGNNAIIEQGLLTDETAVLVHTCPTPGTTLTGIDIDTGEQTWHLQQGNDYQPDEDNIMSGFPSDHEPQFTLVEDLLVLENISLQRGTVVINATTGDLITDDLKDQTGENLLRILPDGYLVLSTPEDSDPGDSDRTLRYELRDFDGSVRHSVVPEVSVGVTIGDLLPLEDSLLKVRTKEETEGETQDLAVLDWETKSHELISLTVDIDTGNIVNFVEGDRAVGPTTFREVPGAVLLREYSQNDTPRLTALR